MKELFYVGKETSTGNKVLVLMDDFNALPREKAVQSLLDMGVEVDTSRIVAKKVQEEPEIGTQEFFDKFMKGNSSEGNPNYTTIYTPNGLDYRILKI